MTPRPVARGAPPPPAAPDAPVLQEPVYYRAYAEGDGIQLRELVDIVLRGKWIILATLLAVAAPVTAYTLLQPSVYRASSLLLVSKDGGGLANVLPSGRGGVLFQEQPNLSNELLVLRQSEALADSVARVLMGYRRIPGTDLTPTILLTEGGGEAPVELVSARLQSRYVSASLEGDDVDAIRVTAVSTIPAEAALIANVYAEAFVHMTREQSRASVNATRTFLESQVERQASRLEDLDDAVRDYMTREGAVDLDVASQRVVAQLGELEGQRDAVAVEAGLRRATIDQLERELAAIEPRLADFVAGGVQREIDLAQQRIAEVEGRLETIYTRNPDLRHAPDVPPDVQALRDEAERLRHRVADLTRQYLEEAVPVGVDGNSAAVARVTDLRRQLAEARIALSGLEAQRTILNQRIAEYEAELRAIPTQAIEIAQMQRDRQATERLYTALEEKLQEARVAEQSQLGYADMVRSAAVPAAPFSPNRPRNVALGLLLGLGLGLALAVVKTRLDHRIHRPDDLRDRGYPVVGTIPDMAAAIREDFGGAEAVTVDGRAVDAHLVALLNPMAVASEAYRALRTSIQFSRPDVVVETILVTSSGPGEGKSVTAANLAVVMAQAGRRTLLVDADLRLPTVHKKFGRSREPGLVQVLFQDGPIPLSEFATPMDNLFVIPAGAHAHNPSELLGSRAMRELVEAFREAFDCIVFDAPPVLAATDAVLLSTQCDATLLVVEAGETRDYDLAHAQEQLEGVGAKVIGTVLNGFDVSKAYGYKYKYQYRYGGAYAYGKGAGKGKRGRKAARP